MGAVKEARSRINALSGRKFCHWPGRPVRDNPQPGCPASRSIVKSLKNRKLKNIIDLHALNRIPQKFGEKYFIISDPSQGCADVPDWPVECRALPDASVVQPPSRLLSGGGGPRCRASPPPRRCRTSTTRRRSSSSSAARAPRTPWTRILP